MIQQQEGRQALYIITVTEYLTRWVEAQLVEDCISTTISKFLFEYVLTWFGFPKVLMSDRGMHFLNERISAMLEEFQVYHQKSTPYHPQSNGIPTVLWAYQMTCKNLTGLTPFRLVYEIEVVMPMEYIVTSLHITDLIEMMDCETLEGSLTQLMELEEDRFLAGFHHKVEKECEKAWYDRHTKLYTFRVNDLALLYHSKSTKFPSKFKMHWFRPYVVKEITSGGVVQLVKLNGELFLGRVNGS
eukprot:PITA_29983